MENLTFNVRDIDPGDRQVLEHVIGRPLHQNLQLIIQIVGPDSALPTAQPADAAAADLPEWCNVYAGLSDEEIAEVEKIALTRVELSRPSE